jgi:peptidoglycan/xylan/chitin deacetylase (PgdA/CDA1 family)
VTLKRAVYHLCKWAGLFALARRLTPGGLRILCYHGFAVADETEFRPGLFIRAETFRRRLAYLAAHNYPVISLEDAIERLSRRALPPNATVITVDDGFSGFHRLAWPELAKHSFPSTVYVTSYYAGKQQPIFRLAVQYMFWKTQVAELDTSLLGLPEHESVALDSPASRDRVQWQIIRYGESDLSEPQRNLLAARLGERLGVDYGELESNRAFTLMTPSDLRELDAAGVDIQLHTHRHVLPEDEASVEREIGQNREFLEPLTSAPLRHFCYPSGIWSHAHWPWLDGQGVITATTCDQGFNYSATPRLGLKRFLDGENISQIHFEAEVSGFTELLRSLKRLHMPTWLMRYCRASQ